jgi:Fe-S-cluster-containing hydrogenase component 2
MLAVNGIPTTEDLQAVLPAPSRLKQGPVAVIECFQQIPCNPCAEACPRGAITMPGSISERPVFDESKCNGCGLCVTRCPGLAIFVVDYNWSPEAALLKMPYEFAPLPASGEVVEAIDRAGKPVGAATVQRVQQQANRTTVLWLAVDKAMAMDVRNIRRRKEVAL